MVITSKNMEKPIGQGIFFIFDKKKRIDKCICHIFSLHWCSIILKKILAEILILVICLSKISEANLFWYHFDVKEQIFLSLWLMAIWSVYCNKNSWCEVCLNQKLAHL